MRGSTLNMGTNRNDDRIIELTRRIDEEKAKLTKGSQKFSPKTNCVLTWRGETFNLNVLTRDQLVFLHIDLHAFLTSAEELKYSAPGYSDSGLLVSGYFIDQWISDIKNKIDILDAKEKQMRLGMEADKLSRLLSSSMQTEMAIDDIESKLKFLIK